MKSLALLVTVALSAMAFAQEQTSTLDVKKEMKISSAQNRVGKNVQTTAEIVGIGPSGVAGGGLNVGFFLSPDSILQLELHGGKTKNDGVWISWDEDDVLTKEGFSAGLNLKYFPGNSFYIKGGANYRQFKLKETTGMWFSNDVVTREFKGESVALGFSVGNQWQFGNFTLGCDWFGVQVPVSSRVYDESYVGDTAYSWYDDDNKEDQERYVTGTGFTLLRFFLGASF